MRQRRHTRKTHSRQLIALANMTCGTHLFYSTLREKAPESVFRKADYELELKEIERMKVQR